MLACPANKGEGGCFCDYALFGNVCHHPVYGRQWKERAGYYPHLCDDDGNPVIIWHGNGNGRGEPDPGPEPEADEGGGSLTARVVKARASGPMDAGRARQLALALESKLAGEV